MSIQQAEINPADNYRTTTTSCDCPSRAVQRPWEPCPHMVRAIVSAADDDRYVTTYQAAAWERTRDGNRKGRDHQERRELRREREAA